LSSTKVKWGWVIRDQTAVVQGMNFGPGWLQGKTRQGPVKGGCHNLIGKDIVFHGSGRGALGAIVTLIRCQPLPRPSKPSFFTESKSNDKPGYMGQRDLCK
jgi:hypothetical protein